MNEELIMGYKAFLDNGKTERECVSQTVSLAKAKGYSELCEKTELKPGDKVYFINRDKSIALFHIGSDDIENGIVGGLVEEIKNPNTEDVENTIIGETFIKPKTTSQYKFDGALSSQWGVDRAGLPLKIERTDDEHIINLTWDSTYSGQFVLSYGDYYKTIVIESLF